MDNFSVTQASNIANVAAAVVVGARLLFNTNIPLDDVVVVLMGIVIVLSSVTSFINRYQKGDLKLSGARK